MHLKGSNCDPKIDIDDQKKKRLLEILKKDSEFFQQQNINDYSLLLGIHKVDQQPLDDYDIIDESIGESMRQSSVLPVCNKKFSEDYQGGILST